MKNSQLWCSEISQTENLMREKRGKIILKMTLEGSKFINEKWHWWRSRATHPTCKAEHGFSYWNTKFEDGILNTLWYRTVLGTSVFNIHDISRINKNKSYAPCPQIRHPSSVTKSRILIEFGWGLGSRDVPVP